MTKLTLQQKRLETLRQQLYGKPAKLTPKQVLSQPKAEARPLLAKEPIYLNNSIKKDSVKSDLIKTLLFASGALIAQLLLYFASIRGIINLSSLTRLHF